MDGQRRSFDRFDECFEKLTPRKIDTFSHREIPCLYEHPIVPREVEEEGFCPLGADRYCQELLSCGEPRTLQEILTRAYSERIKNVLCEPSTSVVIRSEQQFHLRDLARFAQRRHFYEVVHNGTPGDESRFGVGCTPIHEADRFGEYLGFVDLRQHYRNSALAFGLLVEPRWIREDPNTFVISGVYGPLFGAHSFRSSVYSMQDPETIGAVCAQMCAIMALGMLADRKVEVKGSFTLTYLAWQLGHQPGERDSSGQIGELLVGGLKPEGIRDVLWRCRANAKLIKVDCKHNGADDLATRIIEANIYARFPVILAIDAQEWKKDPAAPQEGHAITIVGVRRNALTNEPVAFIVHDPGSGPFMHIRTARCFDAAKAYRVWSIEEPHYWEPGNAIAMVVAATHSSIRRHVDDCVRWLRKCDFSTGHNFYHGGGGNPETFGAYERREPGTDYRLRLLTRNTIGPFLGGFLRVEDALGRSEIDKCVSSLWGSRFWTVVGFRQGSSGSALVLSVVWVFDAGELYGSAPVAKLWRDQDGTLRAWLR